MQNVSEIYTRLLGTPGVIKQHKVTIAGVEYGEEDIVGLPRAWNNLYAGARGPAIGQTNSGEVDLSVLPKGIIPRMAEIRLFTRLAVVDHMAQVVTETSEWLQKGVFLLDTRQKNAVTGALELHGYDRMLLAEDFFFHEGDPLGEWPRAMEPVVTEICARMGVDLEPGTVIEPGYKMPYPEGLTCREILSYCAACHGCNATITESGYLRFAPLFPAGEPVSDLGREMRELETGEPMEPFSGVAFYDGDVLVASAGDETGRVLEVECPWGTEQIAADVLGKIRGGVYSPWAAFDAILDPAVELGDLLGVDSAQGTLARRETVFNALMLSDASAPGDEEVDHEIPYGNKEQRKVQQAIEKNQAILWTGIDQADHLSTSQKIAKYLREDTSEDDFLRIKGLGIVWIRARTDGTEVQATDEDGHPLYWDPDVEKATVEADGWYYVGTEKVKPTIVETPYPVMCYAYEEQVIAEWTFRRTYGVDGNVVFIPTQVMGAGYGDESDPDRGRGTVCKTTNSFEFLLKTSRGDFNGLVARDDYTDLLGARQTTLLDLSRYDDGIITEVVDGGITNELKLTFDEEGDPVLVTNSAGHEMEVRW